MQYKQKALVFLTKSASSGAAIGAFHINFRHCRVAPADFVTAALSLGHIEKLSYKATYLYTNRVNLYFMSLDAALYRTQFDKAFILVIIEAL